MSDSNDTVEVLNHRQVGELTQEQLGTVLMGLRMVQRTREDELYKELERYFGPICTDTVIDDLCDRLNWGTPVARGSDGGNQEFRKKILSAVNPLRMGTDMFLEIFDRSQVDTNVCEHYQLFRESIASWKAFETTGTAMFPASGGNQNESV